MQNIDLELINILNPWINTPTTLAKDETKLIPRNYTKTLLLPDWDQMWLILTGPRQAGKTTLGKLIARTLINEGRFEQLIYLNCDFLEIRMLLKSAIFLPKLMQILKLKMPIFFIDEVQRITNPGLLLKGIADLQLPIKMIASGSSALELKSTVQEHLTGRHLNANILPLSAEELGFVNEATLIYGMYPAVVLSEQKEIILQQLYDNYINKDIIEILKIGKPDVMQNLIRLLAHSSGQLVNYNQLATDCRVSVPTIQHYCHILEQTFMIKQIKPFVGNKRKEIVSNPIYYFIDNGFRNQALRQFTRLDVRQDIGLLVQNALFQEILKFQAPNFANFDIYYWRTQSGAEVDFVIQYNAEYIVPIEAKYRNLKRPSVPKSLRSFINAYQPKNAFMITKDFSDSIEIEGCNVHFVPFNNLSIIFSIFHLPTCKK